MQGPKRPFWRRLKPGRAVFNAASELCRVAHGGSGDSCCGVCYEQIARTINATTKDNRYKGWGTYVINNIDIFGRMPGEPGYDSSMRQVDSKPWPPVY